jgi:hypothetical protein
MVQENDGHCHKHAVIRSNGGIASRLGDAHARRCRSSAWIVRRVSSTGGGASIGWAPKLQHGVSMADHSMTGTFQRELPKDLLTEAQRAAKKPKNDLRVEGWRSSWLTRISEMLVGQD